MKTFFTQSTLVASQTRDLQDVNCLRFTSVSGTITVQFEDGAPITVEDGDTFKAEWPQTFGRVIVAAASASTATFVHGIGIPQGGGGSAVVGGGAGVVGSGSPQGSVTSDPGTTYYDTTSGGFWIKATGTGTNTGWVQLIA